MAKIDVSKKKWARKMATAGDKWKKGVAGKGPAYREGIATFSGESVGPTMPSNWQSGVDAITAADFQTAVSGKEEKWARRLAEAIAS